MRELMYAMRFTGTAEPVNSDGTVMRAATTSPSTAITTTVRDGGVDGRIEPVAGENASFESVVTFSSPSAFDEHGSIEFGDGNRLRFTTVGSGHLDDSPDPSRKHGAVIWSIDGGDGALAGATGLITSNFFVGADGAVTDHHLGVIFLP